MTVLLILIAAAVVATVWLVLIPWLARKPRRHQ